MTIAMKKSFFAALLIAFASLGTLNADVLEPSAYQLFGISAGYNDVFFGDYYGREGDIEGHAAVKGNLTAIDYGFGSGEMAKHSDNKNVLVVGGNVYAKGAGVYDGNAYIGGSINKIAVDYVNTSGKRIKSDDAWNTMHASDNVVAAYNRDDPNYQASKGTVYANGFPTENWVNGQPDTIQSQAWYAESGLTSLPFDFTVAEEQLRTVHSDLWGLDNTITATFNDRNIMVDLTGLAGLQVLTLDAADFMAMGDNRNIHLTNAGDDLTLLINITNETGLDYLWLRNEIVINGSIAEQYGDFDGSNILLNTAMDNVRVENVAFNGSLLALDAEVYIAHGNIDGQVFAGSGYTEDGGEFHAYYTFDDKHFQPAATPEPASLLIVGLGLGAIGLSRRFRKDGK